MTAIRDQATAAVRAGIETDTQHGAIVPPLYLSANYAFAGFGSKRAYDYTRTANPTRDCLGEALAELEAGQGAVVTASGMAAVHLALQLVPPQGLVLAPFDCYGGTWRLLRALERRGQLRLRLVDTSDLAVLRRALDDEAPALVWLETPSNPLLRVTDLAAAAALAHARGSRVVADNTFLSPALQQPLLFGADLVVHSTTKYLNGHSDVVGGAVVAADSETLGELRWWANCLGLTGSPFDAFLTLRGVRTLFARLRLHGENAGALAQLLAAHPAVARVHWPGLPSHEGHAVACRQQKGFGAMLSFELAGGEPMVRAFLAGLRCFSLAESLGGVESLVAHPATMTHAAMDAGARRAAGIGDGLLRLSVGIEAVEDLVADVEAGLARAEDAAVSPAAFVS